MDTLYARIKKRREELEMSQAELADELGYTDRSSIAKIEKGVNDITQSKIIAFAEALHTTPAYLMGWTDDYYDYETDEDNRAEEIPIAIHEALMENYEYDFQQVWYAWLRMEEDAKLEAAKATWSLPANIIPMPEMRKIPLLGNIACGAPILADDHIEEYIDIPRHVKADFALTCKGDSMINARIFNGDVVYIRQQEAVDNGEIAAVLIDNEATLKRIRLLEDRIVLEPANPLYDPLVYRGEEMNSIRILGKAVAFTSAVR